MVKEYEIIFPAISSAGVFLFNTDNGLNYEVRFGRKQDNILHANIVFGVTNEEYEGEEYVETNKGEMYRVMATVVSIVKHYMNEHPNIRSYEFTGVSKERESKEKVSQRMMLYDRYLSKIFNSDWVITHRHNTTYIDRKF